MSLSARPLRHIFLKDRRLIQRHPKDVEKLIDRIFFSMRRELDILQPYIEDEQVSEIMVNGKDHIFVEKNGMIQKAEIQFDTTEDLEELIRKTGGRGPSGN